MTRPGHADALPAFERENRQYFARSVPGRGDAYFAECDAHHRALVTGGAGFVGSHLCARLVRAGSEVVCLDNLAAGARAHVAELEQHRGFRFVRADATGPGAVRGLPGRFDLVLHFACPASPADCLRLPPQTLDVGSTGTCDALERARADGARFLPASTSEVYGDSLEHPQHEGYWGNVNPVGPRSVHDESKRFAEALVTAHRGVRGTDTAIVRVLNSYDPRMRTGDGRAVPTFIAQALDGMPLTVAGDGSQTRSLCYVDDTVDGVLALAASRETGPVDTGGTDEITVLELARRAAELTGSASRIRFVDRHPVRPADRWASLRAQRGNADDALMLRLHGPDWWHRAVAPRGRLRSHLAVTTAGAAACALAAAGPGPAPWPGSPGRRAPRNSPGRGSPPGRAPARMWPPWPSPASSSRPPPPGTG